MTKDEMIALIADEAGISKRQATDAMQTFMGTVTKELKKGEKVSHSPDFGTFSVSSEKSTYRKKSSDR